MPKRTDLSSILIIGAGPIVIGQACEFDYSGVQACKALRAEGYRIILVNSNPATIMTDPDVADATYIEPITPEMVAKIIEKERPDALLPTMGGQTALNTALALEANGTLAKYGVEMIGAKAEVIDKAEDRQKFRDAMDKLGLESPKSKAAHSLAEAREGLAFVGLPAIIRPSFTLAGTGGGIAYNLEEFEEIVERGLDLSPTTEVLIEESVLGWKEYEMEVVRDKADNCIIVCSIENIDPMGVHTGDSITVAPALTLTDKEYQWMRAASIAVLREIGVETGGSNVQFAVNPADGRMVVIEMNPRVSRSSALASKATGFPDRQGRRPPGRRLHAGRADERHHRRRDPGLVRALDRLCGHQDPALRLREISRQRAAPDHRHEVGRRGDGHRPHLQGKRPEGPARPGDRPDRLRRDRDPRRRRSRQRQGRGDPRPGHADPLTASASSPRPSATG
jgi:carbamoyl-phosphate synthase large subunit